MRSVFTLFTLFALWIVGTAATAQDRLPHGGIARASGRGAVQAWYARPTDRYDHGVLGDAIEGGSLVVIDDAGRRHEAVLPQSQVFEDITPRIADLDGRGRNVVVTIRSDLARGAAVAVYQVVEGSLAERAATAPIGQSHRWLSIAGIADFTGRGGKQIAIVKTPHAGGFLELLALEGDALRSLYPPQTGYATHFIGSRIVTLAGIGRITGGAILALPDSSRRRLHVLRFGAGGVETLLTRDLPARIDRPIAFRGARDLAVPLESGETVTMRLP